MSDPVLAMIQREMEEQFRALIDERSSRFLTHSSGEFYLVTQNYVLLKILEQLEHLDQEIAKLNQLYQ